MSPKTTELTSAITVRFAGDSGDGMQLTGDQFTDTAAAMGNDFATFPDFPAEIRAPAGTLPGVSSFQIQFSDSIIFTPGDLADVLVAMNPAALKVNLNRVKKGGLIIINESAFSAVSLKKATWEKNPLEDDTLKDFNVLKSPLSALTRNALADHPIKGTEVDRCKNFFALGILFWIYTRTLDHTSNWILAKFKKRPEIANANVAALKAGYNYADITETLPTRYEINKAKLDPGVYRKITGNEASAMGFVVAAKLANKQLFYGSYPITPASTILHVLAGLKHYNVMTFQAEDEIAACGVALGAAYAGKIGLTGTSGPGICLKAEMMGLAVMSELPLVIVNVQRGGPSTGMPTKTEQSDLLQALYCRNGESPLVVIAPSSPADCFDLAVEAVRIAVKYMTPVIYLSDGNIANAAEPWKLPNLEDLKPIIIEHPVANKNGDAFLPYSRDPQTLARPWATPGTPGLEHRIGGLAKADLTGNVSYDPDNNQKMTNYRAAKIQKVVQDIPDIKVSGNTSGKILVASWGGTFGAVYQAVKKLQDAGKEISHIHIKYLNPFPKNLGSVVEAFDHVLVPELNMGQLIVLLRHHFPKGNFSGYNKVTGQPFSLQELDEEFKKHL
jgi:2-oxoglutarate ferredoxin oxidoreductase subunit alpha